jgi:hypothetical protein
LKQDGGYPDGDVKAIKVQSETPEVQNLIKERKMDSRNLSPLRMDDNIDNIRTYGVGDIETRMELTDDAAVRHARESFENSHRNDILASRVLDDLENFNDSLVDKRT